MVDYYLNLTPFPVFLHRIVKSWYIWQEIYLRGRNQVPGQVERQPKGKGTREQIYWGGRPPEMTDEDELALIDESDISVYLVCKDDGFFIDTKERGSRDTYWMFRKYEDAEKYLLFLISQNARPGKYTDSPAYHWYQQGVNPQVTLTRPDPVNFPGRVSLRVDQESTDRGWMGETDAPAGSHVLVLSFEELDSALREGVPPDWFTLNIRGD